MPFHAYVDESIRGKTYYLVAVRIQSGDIGWMRSHAANRFRFRGQPVHMHHESASVRKQALRELCRLPLTIDIVRAPIERSMLKARLGTLKALSEEISADECNLMVLENISSDLADRRLLREAAKASPGSFPEFRHMTYGQEPLLQLADIAAWSYGRGGTWRHELEQVIRTVISAGPS